MKPLPWADLAPLVIPTITTILWGWFGFVAIGQMRKQIYGQGSAVTQQHLELISGRSRVQKHLTRFHSPHFSKTTKRTIQVFWLPEEPPVSLSEGISLFSNNKVGAGTGVRSDSASGDYGTSLVPYHTPWRS